MELAPLGLLSRAVRPVRRGFRWAVRPVRRERCRSPVRPARWEGLVGPSAPSGGRAGFARGENRTSLWSLRRFSLDLAAPALPPDGAPLLCLRWGVDGLVAAPRSELGDARLHAAILGTGPRNPFRGPTHAEAFSRELLTSALSESSLPASRGLPVLAGRSCIHKSRFRASLQENPVFMHAGTIWLKHELRNLGSIAAP